MDNYLLPAHERCEEITISIEYRSKRTKSSLRATHGQIPYTCKKEGREGLYYDKIEDFFFMYYI